LLDARHAVSVTERQRFILRVRTLARGVAEAYRASREALGFPLLKTGRNMMSGSRLAVRAAVRGVAAAHAREPVPHSPRFVKGLDAAGWRTARCAVSPRRGVSR
jgi:hypothetical protein